MRSRSFAARKVGTVIIYAHTTEPPDDEEWNRVIEFYRSTAAKEQIRVLVYTDGSAPNAAQRARLNDAFGSRRVLLAVLTSSAIARAAGTAVHWFRPDVRVFGPTEIRKALAHLGVAGAEAGEVESALNQLKAELQIGGTAKSSSGAA